MKSSVKMASTKMKIRESEQKLLDAIMNGITLSFVYYMHLILVYSENMCATDILKTVQLYKACTHTMISSVGDRHFWS